MHPQLYLAAQRHLVRSLSCVARRLPCTDVRAFVKGFITVGPKNHFGKLQMFVVWVDLYVMWYMRRWFPSCLVEHLLDPAQDFIRFSSNNGSSMLVQTLGCAQIVPREAQPDAARETREKTKPLGFGQVSASLARCPTTCSTGEPGWVCCRIL